MRVQFSEKEKQKAFFRKVKSISGLTWKQLHVKTTTSLKIKISYKTFQDWLYGRFCPPFEVIDVLCKFGGVNLSDLGARILPNTWGQAKGGKRFITIHGCQLTTEQRRLGGKRASSAINIECLRSIAKLGGKKASERWRTNREQMYRVALKGAEMGARKGGLAYKELFEKDPVFREKALATLRKATYKMLNDHTKRRALGPKGERMYTRAEANIARILLSFGQDYSYEKITKVENSRYRPDFSVNELLIETSQYPFEGYWREHLKKKYKKYIRNGKKVVLVIPPAKHYLRLAAKYIPKGVTVLLEDEQLANNIISVVKETAPIAK